MNVIGNVTGRTCLLVDDIVDSGGTLVNAAEALLEGQAIPPPPGREPAFTRGTAGTC